MTNYPTPNSPIDSNTLVRLQALATRLGSVSELQRALSEVLGILVNRGTLDNVLRGMPVTRSTRFMMKAALEKVERSIKDKGQ